MNMLNIFPVITLKQMSSYEMQIYLWDISYIIF